MPSAKPAIGASDSPSFRALYAPADVDLAATLQAGAIRPDAAESRIDARATRLVTAIRARAGGLVGGTGGVEDFLHAYALSTKESLALMVLTEALLRVPDADTADRLIEDKLKAGDWTHHDARSAGLLVSASAWTLGITARIIHAGETPESVVEALVKRLGLPAVRAATRQALRLLGSHFVLGQTIEDALARAETGAVSSSIPSTCWARAPAPPPTPNGISNPMPAPSTPSAKAPAMPRCRTGRAFR
jgi:RHH-type proline utilization regulon transcriptional repressor/proline dehydrogenase/delta 1-pyrroline-5-carboxylate dehydrogenase